MNSIDGISIGDKVKVNSTGDITTIKSISIESGGYYIWLDNGDRINDINELSKVTKITNYERLIHMTIEEMAESRVHIVYETGNYENDIPWNEYCKLEDAIKEEIEWLNSEVE